MSSNEHQSSKNTHKKNYVVSFLHVADMENLCLSDMERSLMTAGSRMEQEELAFSLLEGFQAFNKAVNDLEASLPLPGQVVPPHVPHLLHQVRQLHDLLASTSNNMGKEGIPARVMSRVLDCLCGKDDMKHLFAAAQTFDITQNPVAMALLHDPQEGEGSAKKKQKPKTRLEQEVGSTSLQDEGWTTSVTILGCLWKTAMSAFLDYQSKGALTIFPLSTTAVEDRSDIRLLLQALPEIERVYQTLFTSTKSLRHQWRSFVSSEGAVSHPFSSTDKPVFSGALWTNSVLAYAHCPINIKMECQTEHVLPDFDTLLNCMDFHKKWMQYANRSSDREMLRFKEDKIKLVAMMMGEKVFKLVSNGHIDRLYPSLAFHEGNQFHQDEKESFAIKLGLLLMLARNFQTYTTDVKFMEHEARALKNVFSCPFRNATDGHLQAAFFVKHPPCDQSSLVPFIHGAISMNEYTNYEENPDVWIVTKAKFLTPLDSMGLIITQAKERVKMAQSKKRSRSSDHQQKRSKAEKSDPMKDSMSARPPATMTSIEYSGLS